MMRRTPLRPTPLRRRAPLKPGKGLAGRAPLSPRPAAPSVAASSVRTARRRRDTGPDRETTSLLWDRAGGRCEICGRDLVGVAASRHHRQPRGMGGSTRADVNALSNLMLLCGTGTVGCHGDLEANRLRATARGWLVPRGYTPGEVPAVVRGAVVYLTDAGEYAEGAP